MALAMNLPKNAIKSRERLGVRWLDLSITHKAVKPGIRAERGTKRRVILSGVFEAKDLAWQINPAHNWSVQGGCRRFLWQPAVRFETTLSDSNVFGCVVRFLRQTQDRRFALEHPPFFHRLFNELP